MQFKTFSIPGVVAEKMIPVDLNLQLPESITLPKEQQHFLIEIPWDETYLALVPADFKDFFVQILPHLGVRTTDVHTAVCLGFLDAFLQNFPEKKINRKVVGYALALHDIGWSLMSEQEIALSLGVTGLTLNAAAMAPKEKHAVKGVALARSILETYPTQRPLLDDEKKLIYDSILFHDKPSEVAGKGNEMPLEVQILVDLDHLWSFTHQNFWQDTVRKNIDPAIYIKNLKRDLDSYFVTKTGKETAKKFLELRSNEVVQLPTPTNHAT